MTSANVRQRSNGISKGSPASPGSPRVGYATLTKAGQRLLADALVSVESISQEATQAVAGNQIDRFSQLLGQLAGINLSNA